MTPEKKEIFQTVLSMGPMGLARSGGQILYDLAILEVDELVGTRERYAALLYDHFVHKDEPTENFHKLFDILYPISMVRQNPVTFTASLARIATINLLGSLSANKANSNQG